MQHTLLFADFDVGSSAYEILQIRTEFARAYHLLCAGIAEAEEIKLRKEAGSTSILWKIITPVPYLHMYFVRIQPQIHIQLQGLTAE